jgi:hypothetical protein
MKTNLTFILLILAGALPPCLSHGQGCVAIRNMSCSGNLPNGSNNTGQVMAGDLLLSAGYRYFRSFRHFRGKEEEKHRLEQGTEVINYFHGLDLGVTYGISARLSATLTLPLNHNDRSSMYEHYGNSVNNNPDRRRFDTGSQGIGDLRLSAAYWLLNPANHQAGNISLGLGIKAPTGKYDVEGDFHRLDAEGNDFTIVRPVDQSIQLGDGGWGVSLETQAFRQIYGRFSGFLSGFYMANPRNHNGALRNPAADPDNPFNYFSVADQYAARIGLFYSATHRIAFGLGGRLEGIPATDVFGKSEGFRRPGYVVSVEPGLTLFHKAWALNLNVPVALERNRIKNTLDKINGTHGDAAFADYVINASLTWMLPKKSGAAGPVIRME